MRRAFTLVEIMIVVSIVIILITIAVPNILRSRIVANEAATIGNLKIINDACQYYHVDNRTYPDNLLTLSTSSPPYIDSALGAGRKQSYEFIYNLVDADHFTVNANSTATGLLKGRYFYVDESGIIRVNPTDEAGPNDTIVK